MKKNLKEYWNVISKSHDTSDVMYVCSKDLDYLELLMLSSNQTPPEGTKDLNLDEIGG